MSNHKFCGECEHELKYCKSCRVPYCVKCSKEWKDGYVYSYTPNVPSVWYNNQNALKSVSLQESSCKHKEEV